MSQFPTQSHYPNECGEIAELVKVTGTNRVTAETFNCAAIHFRTVYNLQHHQRPVPPIPCLYGVRG